MQFTTIDFRNQLIYIGIDVHRRNWKVAILYQEEYLKVFNQEPNVESLIKHLQNNYPGAIYRCGYEAGFCGFKLCHDLLSFGIECLVLHAADIPTSDKDRRQKTDARDCRKIAACLSSSLTKSINIPSVELQKARHICRVRTRISRDATRIRNRIKSMIYFMGWSIEIPPYWSKRFVDQVKKIAQEQEVVALTLLLTEYEFLRTLKLDALKAVRKLSQQPAYESNVKYLRSLPGMGLVHSMNFLTEIGDIKRFTKLDKLCSIIGLIPNTNASGDQQGVGRMTKRGKKEIKNSLIEAAWIAIGHDPDLKLAFDKYTQRMKKNKAIVRIAKKLLNRIRTLLIEQRKYQIRESA